MLKRVALFLATNLAVILVLSVVLRLLGVDRILDESGSGLNYEALLVLSLVIGFGGSFISLAMSKWMAKRSTGAQVITQPRNEVESWLLNVVARQAQQAGIETPEVAIYPAPDMNAFATGARRNSALVAVSTGLLQGMPRDEVEAVLAHEVSHVANGDMVTLTLVQGVVNTFVIFLSRVIGHVIDRAVLRNESGHGIGYFVSVLVAQVVLGILASIIVMWVSRHREFRADAGSAKLNGTQPMVRALARLERGAPAQLPESLSAFGISGGRGHGIRRLFMSHPPISERIEALQRG
jgi:heat shock protein HtpX